MIRWLFCSPFLRSLIKQGGTHFLPTQFRGPIENGCTTALWSPEYSGSSSQRSGTKLEGFRKFRALWNAAHWGTPTIVCDVGAQVNTHQLRCKVETHILREPISFQVFPAFGANPWQD